MRQVETVAYLTAEMMRGTANLRHLRDVLHESVYIIKVLDIFRGRKISVALYPQSRTAI